MRLGIRSQLPFAVLLGLLAACSADGGSSPSFDASIPPGSDGGPSGRDAGPGNTCSGGRTDCDGVCRALDTDSFNCGACGNACADGYSCESGSCELSCPSSQERCDVDGTDVCISTDNNNEHCGACGNECPTGQVCSDGMCSATCSAGQTTCMVGDETVCADLDDDINNCGECGNRCDVMFECNSGMCELNCGAQTECDGTCVDTDGDNQNCGACGNRCGTGRVCTAGSCELDCDPGQTVCGDSCIDTTADPANCGSCGNACGEGQVCSGGACSMTCGSGETLCGGTCIDTNTDATNCGACGNACEAPTGGSATCTAGSCGRACPSGQTECGGVCRDLNADGSNCGSCGNSCAAMQTCQAGACVNEIPTLSAPTFQMTGLATLGCDYQDHSELTGDDHGGIAVSSSRVFVSGDDATASWRRSDLSEGERQTVLWDFIIFDATERDAYLLADDNGPLDSGGGTATQLFALNGEGALADEAPTPLSMPIRVVPAVGIFGTDIGLFAGDGAAFVHNRSRVYRIDLDDDLGTVTDLGAMDTFSNEDCEGGTYHGIAETRGSALSFVYANVRTFGADRIERITVPGGDVTILSEWSEGEQLNDMCMIAPAPNLNRWYWHVEGSWDGTAPSGEYVGHCNATFDTSGGNFTVEITQDGCAAIDNEGITGDDRGPIAITGNRLLYSGDVATGRWDLSDLGDGEAVAQILDAMISDVRTGAIYTLGNNGRPVGRGGGTITQLIRLDSTSGQLTSDRITLSTPITAVSSAFGGNVGLFHGFGGVAIHNGDRAYWIDLPTGDVTDFGPTPVPDFNLCENWAYWGMAEYFGDRLWISYAKDDDERFFGSVNAIERLRVPDGMTETVEGFTDLGDLCGFAYIPTLRRWYWHIEDENELVTETGRDNEWMGYCPGSHTTAP